MNFIKSVIIDIADIIGEKIIIIANDIPTKSTTYNGSSGVREDIYCIIT